MAGPALSPHPYRYSGLGVDLRVIEAPRAGNLVATYLAIGRAAEALPLEQGAQQIKQASGVSR